MEIDIIILFFNKVDQTISCVNSFLSSGQQIYVLNNGSDPVQLKKLMKTFEGNLRVVILNPGKNLGVSGGRNYLLNHTKSPWIFSVDNDIIVQNNDDWVNKLECFCKLNPNINIITPRLYNVHENDYNLQMNVQIENNKMRIVSGSFTISNCFPGGAAIIHRNIFKIYGLFDEGMFVGFEDYEFALRAVFSDSGALEVHSFDSIELIHDHQFQKNSKDKKAVRDRYNEDKMKASYERLVAKYNIAFEHEWLDWTKYQVAIMTTPEFILRIKQKLSNLLNR
jgi:GT2 family glycosyltransferase